MADDCTLLSDYFGYIIQLILGVLAFSTLLIKRYKELNTNNARTSKTFYKDTLKQGCAALLQHCFNLLFSITLTNSEFIGYEKSSECVWYFLNTVSDNVFGLVMNWLILISIQKLVIMIEKYYNFSWDYEYLQLQDNNTNITNRNLCNTICLNIKIFGKYSTKMGGSFIIQLSIWLLIVTTTKLLLFFGIVYSLSDILNRIGLALFTPLVNYPRTELILVMIIFPFILNAFQFWITDNIIMYPHSHSHLPSPASSPPPNRYQPPYIDIKTPTKPYSIQLSNVSDLNKNNDKDFNANVDAKVINTSIDNKTPPEEKQTFQSNSISQPLPIILDNSDNQYLVSRDINTNDNTSNNSFRYISDSEDSEDSDNNSMVTNTNVVKSLLLNFSSTSE